MPSEASLDASPPVIEKRNPLDIVIFCGSPASGKSTFYRKYLQPLGYERVNQDTLKTIPIRCVHFTAPAKLCEHNDAVRAIAGHQFNPEKRTILPHTAFSSFASRFKQPKMEEGFQDVVPVHFKFQGDDEQRKIWSRYWI
ncbi:MAG: hypothetical protein Q9171_004979 [Xanthocarpia ochracea]